MAGRWERDRSQVVQRPNGEPSTLVRLDVPDGRGSRPRRGEGECQHRDTQRSRARRYRQQDEGKVPLPHPPDRLRRQALSPVQLCDSPKARAEAGSGHLCVAPPDEQGGGGLCAGGRLQRPHHAFEGRRPPEDRQGSQARPVRILFQDHPHVWLQGGPHGYGAGLEPPLHQGPAQAPPLRQVHQPVAERHRGLLHPGAGQEFGKGHGAQHVRRHGRADESQSAEPLPAGELQVHAPSSARHHDRDVLHHPRPR
mmetsp:Transcript_117222/g.365028  ORF Transcript_117222/g.365028 Transcript_117222/m.365028 type:complete len:253 (+) Transcript_117222:260-1018(+)